MGQRTVNARRGWGGRGGGGVGVGVGGGCLSIHLFVGVTHLSSLLHLGSL